MRQYHDKADAHRRHSVDNQLVPRVSPLIARGALLRERSLPVTPEGEVRWVEAGVREQRRAS